MCVTGYVNKPLPPCSTYSHSPHPCTCVGYSQLLVFVTIIPKAILWKTCSLPDLGRLFPTLTFYCFVIVCIWVDGF